MVWLATADRVTVLPISDIPFVLEAAAALTALLAPVT